MIPPAFAPLAAHLWQSTVFAAVAGLLTLALRRNQARVRYGLWLAASCKFLIPFSWLVSLGHQFEWRTAPAIAPSPVFSVMTDAISGPVFLTPLAAAKPAPDYFPTLLFAIWAVWACGFVVVAAGWLRQWLRIRAMVRAASLLPLGFQNDTEKQTTLRIVSASSRLEPGVFGIFHPVMLLPEGIADRLTQAQLQAILAHELCHVRRHDNLTAAIHMLVEAMFWFYPLAWWLGARLIDERERACDEEVLQAGSQAQVYAESIVKVCEFYLESPLTCISGVTGSDLKKRIRRIMKERFGVALSARKKLLLVTATAVALVVPLAAGVLSAPHRQEAATGNRPRFDVASIKQTKLADEAMRAFILPGVGFTATNVPLRRVIGTAYQLTNAQIGLISGGPEWIDSERFDIEAKAEGKPSPEQTQLMLQSLLADRFKLALHHETRQLPEYALVLSKPGKTGPQLNPHTDDSKCDTSAAGSPETPATRQMAPCGGSRIGAGQMSGQKVTMERVADVLDTAVDRIVVDRTELIGTFNFDLKFTPLLPSSGSPSGGDSAASDPSAPPSIFTALQEQLGLKLEPTTGPVDVLAIDHVEQPSDNSAADEQPGSNPVAPKVSAAAFQTQGTTGAADRPQFEVASVKPNRSGSEDSIVDFEETGRLNVTNATLRTLIRNAWGIQNNQIIGEAKWLDRDRYDIEAKTAGPIGEPEEEPLMQGLLADRFRLSVHQDTRDLPAYTLTLGRGGPKFKRNSSIAGSIHTSHGAHSVQIAVTRMSIGQFSGMLGRYLGEVVLNRTALNDYYDFALQWDPDPTGDSTLPSISTAVQEQLGLKLKWTKAPVAVLVIDHVEELSPN